MRTKSAYFLRFPGFDQQVVRESVGSVAFKASHSFGGDKGIQDGFFYSFSCADNQRVHGEVGKYVKTKQVGGGVGWWGSFRAAFRIGVDSGGESQKNVAGSGKAKAACTSKANGSALGRVDPQGSNSDVGG